MSLIQTKCSSSSTQYNKFYDYAFVGLSLSVLHLPSVSSAIKNQRARFQQQYAMIFYDEIHFNFRNLEQNATHILLAKEAKPSQSTNLLSVRGPLPHKIQTGPNDNVLPHQPRYHLTSKRMVKAPKTICLRTSPSTTSLPF